jgi:LacI family transcriptional regulator
MQRWFANQGIPCLVRGTTFHGITLPFLDVDWQATARHAAGMLWRLGHRHVAIMTPPDRLRGVELAVQGAREIHESEFTITELAENGTATGIERIFGRAMRLQHRPTAIIAIRPRQVATLYGCATRAGMRVPDDLSLVSLAREPFLEYLLPEVTGYGIEPEIIAKQVLRRLEQLASGNINPSGNPWLVPDTIKGHSIAAPSG